jgi:hypothetical protein
MLLKKLIIGIAIVCSPAFAFAAGNLAISGTISSSHSEQNIKAGGETLILNLTAGATWVANVTDSLAAISSSFSSSGNWSLVSSALSSGDFSRVNDSTLTITLPAVTSYFITADETVTITIPNTLLLTGSGLNTPNFTVTNLNPVLALSGTATPSLTETNVRGGSFTLIFDVQNDEWHADLGTNVAVSTNFLASITGTGNWSAVAALWDYADIQRTSDTRITLTLPATTGYVITANETVTCAIPAGSYQNGTTKATVDPTFSVTNQNPVLTLSGTATPSLTETNVRAGSFTLIFDVQNDKWQATLGANNPISTAFLASITGTGNWSAVAALLDYTAIQRTSDTRITLTLPVTAAYVITANETVTCAIPAGSYQNGTTKASVDPTFTVTNQNPVLTLSGTATPSLTETNVRAGSFTLIFDVQNDKWQATLGANNPISTAFLAGITGTGNWSAVAALWDYADIQRTSDTRITVTLPASAGYVITANETVTCAIPAGSYQNGTTKASVDPTFTVTNQNPILTISGTATPSILETNIHAGNYTVVFDVVNDTWHSTMAGSNAVSTAFLAGITGTDDWSTVASLLTFANLNRNSATKLTLTLPAAPSYSISANETVSINIPAGSFTGAAGTNPGVAFTILNQAATLTATWSSGSTTQTESQVRAGGLTLTLDCSNNWNTDLAILKTQFIIGLDGGGGSEWNTKVLPNISVTRPTAKSAVITFAAAASFDISSLQTISYAIPDAALTSSSGSTISASPLSFSISPLAAGVSITPASINESVLNGATVDVTLSEETFSSPASLDPSNFSLSTAPANTSITAVTNKTSTSARLTLGYTGDIDVNGSLAVTVLSGLTGGGTLVSGSSTIVAVVEPVITAVSIPNQTYKIGDNVPVTITVQNDGGQTFTLTSGTVAGRSLTGLARSNATTYTASFAILSGTTDYAALSDIPVSVQLQVSGRPGNLFVTPISQNSDLIDANAPVINSYQALGTVHKIGDFVQLAVSADQAGYTVESASTSINSIPYTSPLFELLNEGSGSYYFTYQVAEGNNNVATPAALTGQIVLSDAAGNISAVKNVSAVSGSFSIDANSPIISAVTLPDSIYIPGETMIFSITSNGTGYSISPETFINGISFASGRFSLNGAGPNYTLNYPIQNTDQEVSAGNISVNIVLKDAAGNKSSAVTSFSNTAAIYSTKPTASISGSSSICTGDTSTLFVNLTGKGNWSILVSDGSVITPYNNITSSPFSIKVSPTVNTTYSVTSVTDNSGLANTGSGSATITIKATTPVTISALGSAYSIESPPVNLSATPSGGQFSGPGVVSSTNKFYPSIAGLIGSPHTILYTYVNSVGCVSYDDATVSVVEASGGILLNDLYCYNAAPFNAQAFTDHPEITGEFELRQNGIVIPDGAGIHDNKDNTALIVPALLNPGDYVLTYTYFVDDFLSLSKNFRIEFIEAPKIIGLPDEICENVSSINLTGNANNELFVGLGVSGNGVTGFKFDPKIAGPGNASIIYTDSTANGCKNSTTGEIFVNSITPVQINALNGAYNIEHAPVNLSAVPSGGVFSGPGVESSSNKFYPSIAGILNSPHKIFYTYSNGFGCISNDSASVSVVEASGTIDIEALYCYNASPFNAIAQTDNPLVMGTFKLYRSADMLHIASGIIDNGDNSVTINPSLLSPDDYLLVYKYYVSDTLSLEANFTIEFLEEPKILGFPDPAVICENAPSFNLQGNASFGSFTGVGVTGNAGSGFRFNPNISGNGQFEITYSDSTVNGCKNSVATEITVHYVPELNFTASDSCVLSTPDGSPITFANTSVDQDSVKYWKWDFDDVNSGALNFSNSDTTIIHLFKKSGKYSITLSDTTLRGCFSSKEITFDFGDRPVGSFEVINKCFTPNSVTEFESKASSADAIKNYTWKIHLPGDIIVDTAVTTALFNYQFTESGKYFIEHLVVSNSDCVHSVSDSVTLQPTIVLQTGVPYSESFDANDGGWSKSKIDDPTNTYRGQSWNWGNSGFDNLPVDSQNAWYTHRDTSAIPELSYLISPCYNLAGLDRPMVKMNIYRNFISTQDGVILKTSIDNGETWTTLGNPGDGINWYSEYQTTNYAFGSNFGFANIAGTSADTAWIEARHILDPIADPENPVTSLQNVQFRLEFGAKESAISNYQGFAINDFSITERARFSVLEHFTNTTSTNPYKNKLVQANIKVNNLYEKDNLFEDFVKLEYHTRFPSADDEFNIFNRDVPGARAFYYGITAVPYSVLDGGNRTDRRFDFTDTKYEPKVVDINLRSLEDPPVEMTVEATSTANDMDISLKIKALKNLTAAERVLYVVLYETRISEYIPGNGETQFANVVRGMVPDAGGTPIYQAFTANLSDTTRLEFNFNADVSTMNVDSIRVAAYLQDDLSGEVYQVALSDYSRSPGTYINPNLTYPFGLRVFPNPASDYVELRVAGNIHKSSNIEFFDQLGRKVLTEKIQPGQNEAIINTSSLVRGIYYLRITTDGIQGSEMQKLVIIN